MTHPLAGRRHRLLGLLTAVGLAVTTVLAPVGAPAQAASADALVGTYLHARMYPTSGYPNCHGGAWYESHTGWREFEIHLRGIGALSGKTLTVRVHGAFVGRMRVHHGDAHLYRHSGVPTMAAGDRVRVRTGSGALVSSGRLRRMHHHMMM